MELTKIVCTSCGSSIEIDHEQTTQKCEACGSTFLVSNGLEFALKGTKEHKQISKLRDNLNRAVEVDDHKNILHFTKEILRLIPKDTLATYYYAYANYKFGARRYLLKFYNQNAFTIETDITKIVDHMITYSDLRDKQLVMSFIESNMPSKLEEYERVYNQKIIEEENYASIPRDVFISYRSTEQDIANTVVDVIESDGYTCWISSRNLRPNDNDNYWSNIEDAITKANIFLVITSESAMLSQDVRKELDIAMKLKKNRLEFKIDDTKHTSTFKYFFDGFKWIDATTDIDGALQELKQRIYHGLQEANLKTTTSQEKRQKTQLDEYDKLLNRSHIELINQNYQDAIDTTKEALSLKPNAQEAWFQLFLAENEFSSEEVFHTFTQKDENLDKLMACYQQSAYQQYKKYTPFVDGHYPKTIKPFEDALYEQLLHYINMPRLNPKHKESYIDVKCHRHILNTWNKLLIKYAFDTDDQLNESLNKDTPNFDQLTPLFDDMESIKEHPDFNRSHIPKYITNYLVKFKAHQKETTETLEENRTKVTHLHEEILIAFEHKDYKEALSLTLELFKYDNTSNKKYLYLLLASMKVNNTVDLYKAIAKLRKKKRYKLLESQLVEKLFELDETHDLVIDLLMHCRHKKRKKKHRINLSLRGETS
ncbi:MAG: toll/interleukin-1 receptor domain-containing protein [Candidatus Izemoplasma sp.]|nr:toll/interleukin-1 receptor domain-containing protein [Candidatus Izemoplasma sp.]